MIHDTFPTFSGEVIHGKQLGRTIGFPTANIFLEKNNTSLDDSTYGLRGIIRGKTYHGIGAYRQDIQLFEAHFFDFSDEIYHENISITPLVHIRKNRAFSSREELKKQIELDKKDMHTWLSSNTQNSASEKI